MSHERPDSGPPAGWAGGDRTGREDDGGQPAAGAGAAGGAEHCPVCHSEFEFFPDIERRADGYSIAIGFVYRCPNPQPITTDATGWYTQPFCVPAANPDT